jgi:hypothetical protein
MRLYYFEEPLLQFHHRQAVEDPHDGLSLFGPLAKGTVYGIRSGVIGTEEGIRRFKTWLSRIRRPIFSAKTPAEALFRPIFPGFQTVFGVPWEAEPQITVTIPTTGPDSLSSVLYWGDSHQRVYKTVELFAEKIAGAARQEEDVVDVWFVIIPDEIYKYCRPLSTVERTLRLDDDSGITSAQARKLAKEPSLFPEVNEAAIPFSYEPDFHNQLKAKLLLRSAPLQIIQESTLTPEEFLTTDGRPLRRVDAPSTVAWNLSTTAFYKAGGRPWKLNYVRKGVCYLGLVFKRDDRSGDASNACCAAQMFLDSGDGVVFKGAVGPWYSQDNKEFHLNRDSAREVVSLAVDTYKQKTFAKKPPSELFIHGRVRFNQEEWEGFSSAVGDETNVVGVRINRGTHLKLYSPGDYPVLRGTAHVSTEKEAYLWTVGFVPRLQTYLGKEVPNPLLIDICKGRADILQVIRDILSLTKLNYNACIFADGEPVTLKFADAVGEILTAAPISKDTPPLPFKFYI